MIARTDDARMILKKGLESAKRIPKVSKMGYQLGPPIRGPLEHEKGQDQQSTFL